VELDQDEVLLSERNFSINLYVLDAGKLLVTQQHRSGSVIELMELTQPGVVFGELSVVGKLRSFVTITSREKGTKVSVLKASLMVNLLRADPEMAVRFFRQLAKKLAMIFHSQSHVLDYPVGIYRSVSLIENAIPSDQLRMEDFLAQHFPALNSSIPIKMFDCMLESNLIHQHLRKGQLLLTQGYLCCEGGLLGPKIKEAWELSLCKLKKKGNSSVIVTNSKSNKKVVAKFKSVEERDSFFNLAESITSTPEVSNYASVPQSSLDYEILQETGSYFCMTAEDWNELLQSNVRGSGNDIPERVIEYGRGDTVIQAGHKYNMFAQIIEGSCSLTRGDRVTYLGQGEIIGELSFLTDLQCDFTVTACEDKTSVYMINGSYINELLISNPLLVAKFYRHLSSVLAIRVQDLFV